jgi:HEAT repeat protein
MIESMSSNGTLVATDETECPGETPGSEDSAVRMFALKSLEMIGDRRSIRSLAAALKDEHYEVRETAYQSLRKLGYRAIPDLVLALKDDNFYARMYAALAITDQIIAEPDRNYGDQVVDALTHALLDKSIYVRRSAYDALKVIEYNKIIKSLISSLSDPDYTIRLEGIIALGKIADKRSSKALVKALSDNDVNIRKYAVSALGRIKDKKTLGPILGLLGDLDGGVRKEAVKALGSIEDERAVPGLLKALKDTEPSVREEAFAALNGFRYFMNSAPFITALRGGADVRKAAVKALGRVKGGRAVEPLIGALEDPDEAVRFEAQHALARMGKYAIKPLRAALNDERDQVRSGAARALEMMTKARAKKLIDRSHKFQSPDIWMEIEAAISAYSKERQASLSSFNI